MKIILFNVFLIFSNNLFSQIDSSKMELMSNYLKIDKYNSKYDIYVDTVFKINDYTIYSISPNMSVFSYCIVFKKDSIIHIDNFDANMSKMIYSFNTYKTSKNKIFIKTQYYGDGTSESRISMILLELNDYFVDVVFQDNIYWLDKQSKQSMVSNSFQIIENGEKLIVKKKHNCNDDIYYFNDKFELKLDTKCKFKKCSGLTEEFVF